MFKSPAPHRYSRGNLGNSLTKRGQPNKYRPHVGSKQARKMAKLLYMPLDGHAVETCPVAIPFSALEELYKGNKAVRVVMLLLFALGGCAADDRVCAAATDKAGNPTVIIVVQARVAVVIGCTSL